jgi:hypothetical protein
MFAKAQGRSRYLTMSLDFQSEDELYNNAFEIDRLRGQTRDIFVSRDVAATTHQHRQSLYGLCSELQPIINPALELFSKTYRIEELIV